MQDIRLPGRKHKADEKSRAKKLYERTGNLEVMNQADQVLPVSMDADAMEQLVKELVLRESRKQMEEMLPQNGPLPGPQF